MPALRPTPNSGFPAPSAVGPYGNTASPGIIYLSPPVAALPASCRGVLHPPCPAPAFSRAFVARHPRPFAFVSLHAIEIEDAPGRRAILPAEGGVRLGRVEGVPLSYGR
jgi:hypothetical protein